MSKKDSGWQFHEGEDGVIGHKRFDAGVTLREVHGRDLAEAQALADDIDRHVSARVKGQAEQAKRAADELRAAADRLEGK